MNTLIQTLLITSVFASPLCAATANTQAKPNILFLAIDDLNDWIGVLDGYPGVQTPHLDRLAERGVLFTRAYCAAPACNPSRAALLTGVRPSTSGVYHNPQPFRNVLPDAVTLPQHFKANGYHVIGGGKIFHGSFPDPPSWHEYFNRPPDPTPPKRPVNGIKAGKHFDWGPLDVPDEAMSDYKVAQWGIDYLQKKHDKPFFLAVGFFRPHLPWYVPRKYFDRYPLDKIVLPKVKDDDLDDIPEIGRQIARPEGDHRKVLEAKQWTKAVQGYLASITFVDTCVGRILDALGKSDYADNTIIVMWSDHGWHLGEKKHWRKFTLWEEATRAPVMFVVPGMTKPAQRCDRTISYIDLYPTLVELCGLPAVSRLEGTSIVPLLKRPDTPWDHPAVTTYGRGRHGVRSERWRYIRYDDGTEELYDHESDPMEWTNLAEKPQFIAIKKELARHLPKVNAKSAPYDPKYRWGKKAAKKKK